MVLRRRSQPSFQQVASHSNRPPRRPEPPPDLVDGEPGWKIKHPSGQHHPRLARFLVEDGHGVISTFGRGDAFPHIS